MSIRRREEEEEEEVTLEEFVLFRYFCSSRLVLGGSCYLNRQLQAGM